MKDTRKEIIRIADQLIRLRGYNAFSYADIAKELRIKNAAIHYHFPSKADLGVEVIKGAVSRFEEKSGSWIGIPLKEQYMNYVTLFRVENINQGICLVGALSSSFNTLPQNMQHELRRYIDTLLDWLTNVLEAGKKEGIFTFDEAPRFKAYFIQSAMLASLLLNKILADDVCRHIHDSVLNI